MGKLVGKKWPSKGLTLKRKHPKILKKLAIAFAIVFIGATLYLKVLQPHTLEAQQRIKLESTQSQLIETRKQLNETKTQSEADEKAKQQELEQVKQKLQETEKELQAKRSVPTVPKTYAAEGSAAPATPVSGSCADWMAQAGIPNNAITNKLIIKESGCRPDAVNPSSGACGIPQALPCSKLPCTLQDPVCQLRWMDNYVKVRYGSWAGALAAWESRSPHWY